MESVLTEVVSVVERAISQLQGPLAGDLDAALRVSADEKSRKSGQLEQIGQAMQCLDKLQLLITPPQTTLVERAFVHTDSRVLVCAKRHHLADHVGKQPLTVSELAEAAGIQEDGVAQIIRYLIGMGFFNWDPDTGKISNNRVSELLREDHWARWYTWVDLYADEYCDILKYLPDQFAQGQKRCAGQIFYDTDKPLYQYLAEKGMDTGFHKAIGSVSTAEAPGLMADYPWNEISSETLLDVGAGAGDFIFHYLSHFPEARAAVFELPQTTEMIQQRFSKEPQLSQRLKIHGGDFFVDRMPSHSVCFLKWVIHNWDDDHCIKLLRRIRESMTIKQGVSRVIVVESVLVPGRLGRIARAADIRMLSRLKNKERNLDDYEYLAAESGFEVFSLMTPRGCITQVLDLRPK